MQIAQKSSQPNSQTCGCAPNVFAHQTRTPITLTITHPSRPGEFVTGFLHLWAKYVRGFNPSVHCQAALRGPLSSVVKTKSTLTNTSLLLAEVQEYDSLYICGVASGPVTARRANNLHLPLEPYLGAGFAYKTYNGYLLQIENAVILPTPELPQGWKGLPDTFTRCRNFRFCVYRFGYPPEPTETDALQRTRPGDSIRERGETGFLRRPLDACLDPQSSTEHQSA